MQGWKSKEVSNASAYGQSDPPMSLIASNVLNVLSGVDKLRKKFVVITSRNQ